MILGYLTFIYARFGKNRAKAREFAQNRKILRKIATGIHYEFCRN